MAQPEKSKSEDPKSSLGFVIKVLGLSTILSVGIKNLGPLLPFADSNGLALMMVLTPSLLLGLLLVLRDQRSQ